MLARGLFAGLSRSADATISIKKIHSIFTGPLSVVVYVVLDDDDESIDFKT